MKQSPWPKFFNSLRASCETDLVDQFGIRRACQWIGNSVKVAEKNYMLVKGTDFIEACDGASDDFSQMTRTDAKNSADSAGQCESADDKIKKAPENEGIPEQEWAVLDLNQRPPRCQSKETRWI
jgi:hypothetical protein